MNKKEIKKLALLGISGGMILSGQAQASDTSCEGTCLAAGGCGGKNGCGGTRNHHNNAKNDYYNGSQKGSSHSGMQMKDHPMHMDHMGRQDQQQSPSGISEQELISRMNERERRVYNNLSPEEKELMLKIAAQNFHSGSMMQR